MTEQVFRALKPGDKVVNRRDPAVEYTVTEHTPAGSIRIEAKHGSFEINWVRHAEFSLVCPQENLPFRT